MKIEQLIDSEFLARHPDFKYADSVRLIRERGCWYEQEGFRR